MKPAVESLRKRIEELSPEKRAAFDKLLQDYRGVPSRPVAIGRTTRPAMIPLSYAQERLWFLDQLTPGTTLFNIFSISRINEAIDHAVLERSLNEIVRRHESLRTTFSSVNGEPVQVVAPALNLKLPVIDLRKWPETERETRALQLASDESQRPFNLTRGPLVRFTLLRIGDEDYSLLLTMHHIISDGWSTGLFWTELSNIWEAFANGEPSPLPELAIQYADFAIWQRNWLQGEVLEKQLAYWTKQLADLPVLEIPTDRPRPAVQSNNGAVHYLQLPLPLTAALKALSQSEGATLFVTILAAFQALLCRYTGQKDIVIGTFMANRNHAELESLIGFFVNTLLLRSFFSGDPTFRDILRQVRKTALDAYAHQDLPFPRLVQELRPERDLTRNPLFQVAFQLLNAPNMDPEESGSNAPMLDVERKTALLDLTVSLWQTAEGLGGEIEYNTDLFDIGTIERMADHYQILLGGIVADPNRSVLDIPLFSETEWKQILELCNLTSVEQFAPESVVSLFEGQVVRSPHAVAFLCEDKALDYHDLNRRANKLAHYLRTLGVGPETLTAICLERSFEFVTALLAVFKAGAAYLPLDPSYPAERLNYMLQDSGAAVLLTEEKFSGLFPLLESRTVFVNTGDEKIACQSEANPVHCAEPEYLAYIIYTSGSTGKPKGVAVEHKQILSRLHWMWKAYPFQVGEVCCQKTATSFVDSVWEVLGPLLRGVPTVIIPDKMMRDPQSLTALLARHKVTRIWTVPLWLRMMLDTYKDLRRRLPDLTFWVATGETLAADLCQQFYRQMPGCTLYNLYGTSEIWDATWYETPASAEFAGDALIGRPISNVQAYVLDSHLHVQPIGVPGELCIAGAGLARCYRNLPELTAERFLPDPFTRTGGGRLYKTGDLARYLPDGNIEFLGRADRQIKIRGFRVELEEIEAVVMQFSGVRQAALAIHESPAGDARLVAYVVPDSASRNSSDASDTEAAMSEQLSRWQEIWDETYREHARHPDATFNISGWKNSHTRSAFSAEEMREWVDHAVDKVCSFHPRNVLDIGCGAGLLLFRIAPISDRYCACDFSPGALNYIRQQLKTRDLSRVTLLERSAEDFSGFEPASFDTVILNSVTQYFPGIDYLVRVLESAVKVVQPGGRIFVGDVRSLPLLEAFHASVLLHTAPGTLSLSRFRQRIDEQLAHEDELAIDPAFFFALQRRLPQITRVHVSPKRGRYRNELTRFRYDVILHVQAPVEPCPKISWKKWTPEEISLSAIRQSLDNTEFKVLALAYIPDARIAGETRALELLAHPNGLKTVADLRDGARALPVTGLDPEDIVACKSSASVDVQLHWSGPGYDDCFHAAVMRQGTAVAETGCVNPAGPSIETDESKPWSAYANNPVAGLRAQQLVPRLLRFLRGKLPDYMVPTAFVTLEALPLTPSGKLDRRALPAPDKSRPKTEDQYVPARTQSEEVVAATWAELLGLERVGSYDNFFQLGGHSLLATRVLARMREAFHVDLPVRVFFEAPTVAGLAEAAEQARARGELDQTPAIVRVSREEHKATLLPGGVVNPSDLFKGRRVKRRAPAGTS
jgi:amino acid adenylation domain-containing protein